MNLGRDDGSTGAQAGPSRRFRLPGDRSAVGAGLLVVALVLVGVGWFLLSRLVAHNDIRTAVRETVGVGLGLLILISAIGAIRNGERTHRRDE
jgi:hypothetical protein